MEAMAEEGKKEHEPLRLTGVYATSGGTQRSVLIRKFFMLYWRNPNYSEFFVGLVSFLSKGGGGAAGWGGRGHRGPSGSPAAAWLGHPLRGATDDTATKQNHPRAPPPPHHHLQLLCASS